MVENCNVKVILVLVILCNANDIVHGICNVTRCTDETTCVMSQDQQSCKCNLGYYGDLCDKDATINVMCGKDFMTIMVIEDFFQYYKIPLESLHLSNSSCRAHREVISGVPYYAVRTIKDRYITCGVKLLQTNITHITYTLTLMSSLQVLENIIRDPIINIQYSCIYPYIRTVSLPYPVFPFSSKSMVRVNELEAKVEMLLYKDHTYTEPYRSAPMVHLSDKVYVEVKVTEPEDFFHLRLNECWATQSPNPNSTEGSTYTLLDNGCAKDETVDFQAMTSAQTGSNGESSTVRYTFNMFRFVALPLELYLHCSMHLCSPDDDKDCIPECKTITKREAVHGDPAQVLLSYGPIKVKIQEGSKSDLLLMTLLPVAGIWVLGIFLLTIITIAKASNRRLARLNY